MICLRVLIAVGSLALWPGVSNPVGRFRLMSVDGERVPMEWQELERDEGGSLRLYWVAGHAEVRKDGRFVLALSALRSGLGFPGRPETVEIAGTWRPVPGDRIELRFADGSRTTWDGREGFVRLVVRATCTDLEGRKRVATLVLVRD